MQPHDELNGVLSRGPALQMHVHFRLSDCTKGLSVNKEPNLVAYMNHPKLLHLKTNLD